ncbi:hypothetical protein M407DRAFT_20105 [Tulasnella calospora MUT 4182]|uniref:DUF7726 domain-containing protein n=1 Tax=Tulasnella calospora MUT 4182 TaxID=1051891 RepID=A0A0C3QGK2_9AGAM|nr:hypothetical protein M407DRAFT_20105 [Tulasnella calospora MUT 4182]
MPTKRKTSSKGADENSKENASVKRPRTRVADLANEKENSGAKPSAGAKEAPSKTTAKRKNTKPKEDIQPLVMSSVVKNLTALEPSNQVNTVSSAPHPASSNPDQAMAASFPAEAPSKPKKKRKAPPPVEHEGWEDIILEGELEGQVEVYDNCDEIRDKIDELRATPGFKVTPWLRQIGNVNSNSFRRFMAMDGYRSGAGNITYYAAYLYFEKRRIWEGMPKSEDRLWNEENYPEGFELRTPTEYVIVPAEWAD